MLHDLNALKVERDIYLKINKDVTCETMSINQQGKRQFRETTSSEF